MARDWVFTWRVTEEEKALVRKAIGYRQAKPPSRVTRKDVEAWFLGSMDDRIMTLIDDLPDEEE